MASIKEINVGGTNYDIKAKYDIDGNEITSYYAPLADCEWVELTLPASGWNNAQYTISDSRITANSWQEITPPANVTPEQLEILQAANIQDISQTTGSLVIKAFGDVPTVDVKIRVIFYKGTQLTQNAVGMDATPTAGSTNVVQSNGVYTSWKDVLLYESRGSSTSLNKTAAYGGAGRMFHLVATGETTKGKTPSDANILQMNWDNTGGYDAQLGISTATPARGYFRSRVSEEGTWQEIAHAPASTQIGSNILPTYLSNTGVITACKAPVSGAWWSTVPNVASNGVMEIGKYIDFHSANTGTSDYDVRLNCTGSNALELIGNLTVKGNVLSNGYLKSTLNSNTVTIGSQNSSFCHIYNSANIPFIFNNNVLTTANHDLGSNSYPWRNAYFTSPIYSTYQSATWLNSVSNSVITINGSGYGGWICGPTKNGRIAISSYASGDDKIYIGYCKKGETINSFTRQMYWDGSNGYLYANSHQTISSRKNKKEISSYNNSALEKINKINIVSFKFNSDDNSIDKHIGFIAEDTPEEFAGSEHNRMDLNNCIGMLLKAVQELSKEVEELKYANSN